MKTDLTRYDTLIDFLVEFLVRDMKAASLPANGLEAKTEPAACEAAGKSHEPHCDDHKQYSSTTASTARTRSRPQTRRRANR